MLRQKVSIIGVPLGHGAGKPGAEGGGGALRTAKLLDELGKIGYDMRDCGTLPAPPAGEPGNPRAKYLKEIVQVCDDLAGWMETELESGHFPLVIGGDHCIGAGTVAGTSAFHHKAENRIGVIWIDAHGDMNTPETSPSGNVHGMPLACCVGLGPEPLVKLRGFAPKVHPRNTVLVGIRELDPREIALIEESGVRAFTIRDIDERGMFNVMNEAIAAARQGTAGFHLSLDMDALDPSIAPGVGTPVPGGLTYREAHLALEMIADTESLLSMDVVEVNPMLDEEGLTARMAVGLIASALGKRILPRKGSGA